MNSTSLRKSSIALAIVAAMCTGAAVASTSGASLLSVAPATTLHHGDAIMGALPATSPMHVVIALKIRDADGLAAFNAKSAKNPGSIKPMSHATFMANHAPSQVDAQTVANYLTNMGFKNVTIAPNRMLVGADGTAANAGKAFLTSFSQVKTHDNRIAYANTTDAKVPASLGKQVLTVLGMQTVNQAHVIQPRRQASVHPMDLVGHNPVEFSSIYGGTGVANASGIPVGIFMEGDPTDTIADLNTFTTANGLSPVTTSTVKTNGGGTGTDVEWELDSQSIVGMSGGSVGSIIFYTIPSLTDANMVDQFNTIVDADATKIINVSIGGCETGAPATATDQILSVGVAQGQTFSISTGDSGADVCGNGGTTPSWPANSPYAVAVAGTTLDASATTWNSETVWDESGGSASTYEPKPPYQEFLVPGKFRGVADVAFDADPNTGAILNVGSGTTQVGGTSLSAPIFAGLWARVLAVKGTDFGFANPYIYQLPQADFRDVTVGSNGLPAKVGYDFASGRGSIILNQAIQHIGQPNGIPPTPNFTWTTQGLRITVTDTSTDDGTIIKRFWNFGDGSPPNSDPVKSHTYAGDGTYNVSVSVEDNDLNTATKTVPVTVTAGGAIKNTGFENGVAPWVFSSPEVRNNDGAEPAHAGTWDAWLGGTGHAHTDSVSQKIHVPAGKASATVTYWLHIDTFETQKIRAFDKLTVSACNGSGGGCQVVGSFDNRNAAAGYQAHSFDMSSYIGKGAVIKFSATEDASLQTSFVIDDVTMATTTGGGG